MSGARPFLGLEFAELDLADAAAALRRAAAGPWRYVVTPNAAHLARLRKGDPGLVAIYGNAGFCFLDSRVIALAARLVGLRPPPVVAGSDLVAHLFEHEIGPDTPICVVGGDVAAIDALRARFGLRAVRHMNPSHGFWRDAREMAATVAFVVASQAEYTFLVLGSPQQEMVAARVAEAGGARGVGICAGAAIDFLTGAQRRAPRIMQRLALEWAYRFLLEPRRLARRYLVESPGGVLLVFRAGLLDRAQPATGLGRPARGGG